MWTRPADTGTALRSPNGELHDAVVRRGTAEVGDDRVVDALTALAVEHFGVALAAVTVVEDGRVSLKANAGSDEFRRYRSATSLFVASACGDDVWVVEDAALDTELRTHPLVAEGFGLRFVAAAPLVAAGGTRYGTLCIADRSARTFSAKDRSVLQGLAAAISHELQSLERLRAQVAAGRDALESAEREIERLTNRYQRKNVGAAAMQSAFLPQALPNVLDVSFSAIYEAADEDERIGGDWYDAFPLDERRVLLTVGDVTGHGPLAAGIMAKLLISLRALAREDVDVDDLLWAMDGILRREHPDAIASAFAGILDARTGDLEYANAGHPNPLLWTPGEGVGELAPHGYMLGVPVAGWSPERHKTALRKNALLVLYTDGLTEATRNIIEGERRLVEAVQRVAPRVWGDTAREIADDVLRGAGSHDDVAILTVRYHGRKGDLVEF